MGSSRPTSLLTVTDVQIMFSLLLQVLQPFNDVYHVSKPISYCSLIPLLLHERFVE